jgi:hypothetical protein
LESIIKMNTVATLSAITTGTVSTHRDPCYKDGYETGRNGPFSQDRFADCGIQYEHGFMAGCLSMMGNDREVCNLAEDAGQ